MSYYGPRQRTGVCLRCGTYGPLTRDHIIPKARLRQHKISNDAVNFQTLCHNCNRNKGHRLIIDYRPSRSQHVSLLSWMQRNGIGHIRVTWQPSKFLG